MLQFSQIVYLIVLLFSLRSTTILASGLCKRMKDSHLKNYKGLLGSSSHSSADARHSFNQHIFTPAKFKLLYLLLIQEKCLALAPLTYNCFKDEELGVVWLISTLFSLILMFSKEYFPILLQLSPQTFLKSSSLVSLNSLSLYFVFDLISVP